ncbi:unnamed protein product [Oncorhynchus mykiss]|uniref:Reverse transcriptase RNase H-like domain-containing protein n=1 Tax=Oncorhynchus mykiss TaxID=8022 RepID=A0A060W4D5_ONCMY|nr:unnamed protein product [Oncorhynchus mykiss]
MALEEWRHWLEEAEQPFLVWADHKNLEYLCTAKRLKSRQDRWALLFTRFIFTISYCPGSKNVKPDTLSRLHNSSATPSTSETILPTSCLAATVDWGIENLVREAQCSQPGPEEGPANWLFSLIQSGPGSWNELIPPDGILSSRVPSYTSLPSTTLLVAHNGS